ncbi:MAG: class I SAM-dependent methyltransferase [Candidatus Omnitrophica bacterium]|nr:class I SAM-dependent methyltransferase [Candidatus Omnitrophota bacterium]MBU1868999.1 class I SAM-dependent methyltransferase [Candidatus Omnitrophota bacterium]
MEKVNCILCGSWESREICSYKQVKIAHCEKCGFIYRNPRLKKDSNEQFYSFDYYKEYEGIDIKIIEARLDLFRTVLKKLSKKISYDSRKILDVGCGHGHFLKLARDLGWNAKGVELSKTACAYAKEIFGLDVVDKSVDRACLNENYFDTVTLWNVLDHLSSPLVQLKEIRRLLKPRGVLFIRVPNVSFHLFVHKLFRLLPQFLKTRLINDPSVITNYGFSSKTIKKILNKTGFCNIAVYNSPLSSGDPYKSASFNQGFVKLIKLLLNMVSNAVYFLSFGKFYIGSSLIIYAEK